MEFNSLLQRVYFIEDFRIHFLISCIYYIMLFPVCQALFSIFFIFWFAPSSSADGGACGDVGYLGQVHDAVDFRESLCIGCGSGCYDFVVCVVSVDCSDVGHFVYLSFSFLDLIISLHRPDCNIQNSQI